MGRILPITDLSLAEHVRRPKGIIVIDGIEVASTRQCCHCAHQWLAVRGSGIARGFCLKCMGDTCGGKECNDSCTPFEKRLDLYEKGLRKTL